MTDSNNNSPTPRNPRNPRNPAPPGTPGPPDPPDPSRNDRNDRNDSGSRDPKSDRRDSKAEGRDTEGDSPREGGKPKQQPGQKMPRNVMYWLLLGGVAVMLIVFMNGVQNQAERISQKEFFALAKEGSFEKVVMEETQVVGTLTEDVVGVDAKGPRTMRRYFKILPNTQEYYVQKLDDIGVGVEFEINDSLLLPFLFSWGPFIIFALLLYFFVFRGIRNAGGGGGMLGNFGRSRHRLMSKEHSTVKLDDVAGIDEAKDEVSEIIEFLKNPKRFQRLGGRVPRGVLLIGLPGCGKTLLAKAVAGEADVPFFSISGSDFVEMFVGVGASRVRDLFKQAKDSSPCIIFLDEVDAVGRKRGNGMSSGGHDEREQTLNAILVEMDGFESSDQVIVVAATNRADVLDPALTRPGRFDRQIHVPLPDVRGRMEILKVHSRRIKMGPDAELEKLARGTPMFSGADLAAIINEAAIGATLLDKDFVEMSDLEEARDKVRWGRARKSHKIEEDEKKVIAYHEAGHAIVMYFDTDSEPLHKVTIIPRGQALGVTFMLPQRDRYIHTRNQLMSRLRVTYGGRIAEDMFCGDISSGAAQDIRQASGIARAMVTEYGMSDKLGFQLLGLDESRERWEQPDQPYSEQTAALIDEEIKALIDRTYQQTRVMIQEHREQLVSLAEALLKYETLTKEDVDRLVRGEALSKPTVSELLRAEQDKSQKDSESSSDDKPVVGDDAPGAMPSPA